MNTQFNQPNKVVSVEVDKQSIARNYGVKHSEVTYAKPGQLLDGYKVIFDKVSQRSYSLPTGVDAGSTLVSLINGVLVTSNETFDLGKLAVIREEFVKLQPTFLSGFTITVPNEIVTDGNSWYRWDGALPKTVAASSTPGSTGGIGLNAWKVVWDTYLRSDLISGSAGKGDSLISVQSNFEGGSLRTQHQKNADTVNVLDFQSPELAIASGAKTIHFSAGNHVFTQPTTIPVGVTLDIEDGAIFSGALVTVLGEIKAPKRFLATIPYPKDFVVLLNSNLYKARASTFGVSPEEDDGSKWGLVEVNISTELNVPSRFSTAQKAVAFIDGCVLNAKTTIRFAAGTHNIASISPSVRNGLNLWFSGVAADRSLVVLNTNTTDGFVCYGTMTFSISDLTIKSSNWTSHGVWSGVSNGVIALQGGRLYCKNVFVTKCYYGFQAAQGGIIDADGCASSEAGDGGFFAFNGGHINTLNCDSYDHYDTGLVGVLGFGFVAEAGGTMWVRKAKTYGCLAGIFANIGSSIRGDNIDSYGNGNGVIIRSDSVIELSDCNINNNISDNVYCVSATFTCFRTKINQSQSGSGIYAVAGAKVNCSTSQTNSNKVNGISCDLLSCAKLNSSHESTSNLNSAYSPAFGTSGNKNSWIDN